MTEERRTQERRSGEERRANDTDRRSGEVRYCRVEVERRSGTDRRQSMRRMFHRREGWISA